MKWNNLEETFSSVRAGKGGQNNFEVFESASKWLMANTDSYGRSREDDGDDDDDDDF